MAGFRESLTNFTKGVMCEFFSAPENPLPWLATPTPARTGLFRGNEDYQKSTEGARALFCDVPPLPGAEVKPQNPILGQCPGVRYVINNTYVLVRSDGTESSPITDNIERLPGNRGNIFGPVTGPIYTPAPNGQIQIQYRAFDSDGNRGTFPAGGGPAESIRHNVWEPLRTDGQPDDCGGLSQPEVTAPVEYEPGDGGPTVVIAPVAIIGNPVLQINGELTVPIDISTGDINIRANYNLSTGDVSFNFGGGHGGEDCCTTGEEIGGPGEQPGGFRRIAAIDITGDAETNQPKVTVVFNSDGPDLLLPDVGSVFFETQAGLFTRWIGPYRVQHLPARILVPQEAFVVNYSVLERTGVSLTATPVYATVGDDDPV